jgi:hypothetical protein
MEENWSLVEKMYSNKYKGHAMQSRLANKQGRV